MEADSPQKASYVKNAIGFLSLLVTLELLSSSFKLVPCCRLGAFALVLQTILDLPAYAQVKLMPGHLPWRHMVLKSYLFICGFQKHQVA